MERQKQNGQGKPSTSIRQGRKGNYHRSRITNGYHLLPFVDGRSLWARLMRDEYEAMVQHCGGADDISEAKRLLCRRVAVIEAELVYQEDRLARIRAEGREPKREDLDVYGRLANGQRRHLEALGLNRTPKPINGDSNETFDRFIDHLNAEDVSDA